jgi:hypothetical protein
LLRWIDLLRIACWRRVDLLKRVTLRMVDVLDFITAACAATRDAHCHDEYKESNWDPNDERHIQGTAPIGTTWSIDRSACYRVAG